MQESLDRARHLIQLNRADQAIPLLTDALRESPDDPRTLAHLAWAYLCIGDNQQALVWSERAVAADPDRESSHSLRAFALLGLGRTRAAIGAAREAVRLAPAGAGSHWALSRALLRARRWREALAVGKELLELYPEDEDSHRAQMDALLGMRRWRNAEHAAREALRLAPEATALHLGLARALWGQRRLADALRAYRDAVLCDPGDALARDALSEQVAAYLMPAYRVIPWHLWMCATSFLCWSAHRALGWWTWWGLLWALVVQVSNTSGLMQIKHWIVRYRRRQYDAIPPEVQRHLWRAQAFQPGLWVSIAVFGTAALTALTLIAFTVFPRIAPPLPEFEGRGTLALLYLIGLFFSVVKDLARSSNLAEAARALEPPPDDAPGPERAAPDLGDFDLWN